MKFGYQKLYIGGELVDSSNELKAKVICPATGEPVAEVAEASKEDAHKAIEAARKGFKYWSKLPLTERTEWMLKLRKSVLDNEDMLRQAMVYEMGKT